MGTFKNNVLVGHVPIEISRIIYFFLGSDTSAAVSCKVTGKRKREVGLVVPALYVASTDSTNKGKNMVKILENELKNIKERYPHFNIVTTDCMSRPLIKYIE